MQQDNQPHARVDFLCFDGHCSTFLVASFPANDEKFASYKKCAGGILM